MLLSLLCFLLWYQSDCCIACPILEVASDTLCIALDHVCQIPVDCEIVVPPLVLFGALDFNIYSWCRVEEVVANFVVDVICCQVFAYFSCAYHSVSPFVCLLCAGRGLTIARVSLPVNVFR